MLSSYRLLIIIVYRHCRKSKTHTLATYVLSHSQKEFWRKRVEGAQYFACHLIYILESFPFPTVYSIALKPTEWRTFGRGGEVKITLYWMLFFISFSTTDISFFLYSIFSTLFHPSPACQCFKILSWSIDRKLCVLCMCVWRCEAISKARGGLSGKPNKWQNMFVRLFYLSPQSLIMNFFLCAFSLWPTCYKHFPKIVRFNQVIVRVVRKWNNTSGDMSMYDGSSNQSILFVRAVQLGYLLWPNKNAGFKTLHSGEIDLQRHQSLLRQKRYERGWEKVRANKSFWKTWLTLRYFKLTKSTCPWDPLVFCY